MQEFVNNHYLVLKALHLIAMISWMAGLLYLPRLYVYHAGKAPGSESSEMLKTMEHRLLRYIMNPAMIMTLLFGLLLASHPDIGMQKWLHAKLGLVFLLFGFHGFLARCRKDFAADRNSRSAKFYKIINEVPTVFMIIIVMLAVTKPF